MSQDSKIEQVKSKKRVADHGEVFTAEREVNAMLDLVSLGVFNSALMNDAVYKFKRYEDSSLEYVGINKHEGQNEGLYDTVITRDKYESTFENED